jgi:hypothetical protein
MNKKKSKKAKNYNGLDGGNDSDGFTPGAGATAGGKDDKGDGK